MVGTVRKSARYDDRQMNMSKDFCAALEEKVKAMIEEACKRAQSNSRTTVMAKDL